MVSAEQVTALSKGSDPAAATRENSQHETFSGSQCGPSTPGNLVFVLGCHRSGTSLATGLLNGVGFPIGPATSEMRANGSNSSGFFEQQPIADLNDQILGDAGGSWFEPPSRNAVEVLAARFSSDITSVVSDLYPESELTMPYLIKDPRIAVLRPAWELMIASAPLLVLCRRNPLAVARSLMLRDQIPVRLGLDLWEKYTAAALNCIEGRDAVLVDYELNMRDTAAAREFIRAVAQHLKVNIDEAKIHEAVDSLLDESLDHSVVADGAEKSLLTQSQAALWDRLKRLPVGPIHLSDISDMRTEERPTLHGEMSVIELTDDDRGDLAAHAAIRRLRSDLLRKEDYARYLDQQIFVQHERIGQLVESSGKLSEHIAHLEATNAQLQANDALLREDNGLLRADITRLMDSNAKLEAHVALLQGKVSRLWESLTAKRQDTAMLVSIRHVVRQIPGHRLVARPFLALVRRRNCKKH